MVWLKNCFLPLNFSWERGLWGSGPFFSAMLASRQDPQNHVFSRSNVRSGPQHNVFSRSNERPGPQNHVFSRSNVCSGPQNNVFSRSTVHPSSHNRVFLHPTCVKAYISSRFLVFPCASLCFLAFPCVSLLLSVLSWSPIVLVYKTSCFHDPTCAREAHVQTHTRPGPTSENNCDRVCDRYCNSCMPIMSPLLLEPHCHPIHFSLCIYKHRNTLVALYSLK